MPLTDHSLSLATTTVGHASSKPSNKCPDLGVHTQNTKTSASPIAVKSEDDITNLDPKKLKRILANRQVRTLHQSCSRSRGWCSGRAEGDNTHHCLPACAFARDWRALVQPQGLTL